MENISIASESVKLSFSAAGAELISAIHGKTGQEFIWTAEPSVWPRHTPVLFPFVGKSVENQILWQGKKFPMSQHGFARDQVFELSELYTDLVSFQLQGNPEKFPQFPFPFVFRITYQLESDKLIVTYITINPGNKAMYYSVGAHPGFLLPKNDLSLYAISFEKDEQVEISLLTNGLISEEKKPLKLKSGVLQLNSALFKDDALVFESLKSRKIKLFENTGTYGIEMEFPDFPYLGIWTKYPNQDFICLEPWHGLADRIGFSEDFSERKGIIKLEPGEMKSLSYSIRFLASS